MTTILKLKGTIMGFVITSDVIVFSLLAGFAVLWLIWSFVSYYATRFYKHRIKGLKLYKAETVMSVGGCRVDSEWHESNEKALEKMRGDFISQVYPCEIRIKPIVNRQ